MDRWSRTEYRGAPLLRERGLPRPARARGTARARGDNDAGRADRSPGAAPSDIARSIPRGREEAELIAFSEKMQQPRNHVIMQLADCDELADFRAGKRQSFDRYGQFFVPISDGAVMIPTGIPARRCLTKRRTNFPSSTAGRSSTRSPTSFAENADGDVAGVHFLGVLKQDDAGLYLGIAFGNPRSAIKPSTPARWASSVSPS